MGFGFHTYQMSVKTQKVCWDTQ